MPGSVRMDSAIYGDIDDSPTKTYMMEHRDDAQVKPLFDLAFEKRPAEELYDLRSDPHQLQNVASDPAYADTRKKLESSLLAELRATGDPRVLGGAKFDDYPYYGGQQPKRR